MFGDEVPGIHRLAVAARFRNLLAVDIDHKAVRDAGFVRRAVMQRDARHE